MSDIETTVASLVGEFQQSGLSIDEFLLMKTKGSDRSQRVIDAMSGIDHEYDELQRAKKNGHNRQEWLRERIDAVVQEAGLDKKPDVVGKILNAAVAAETNGQQTGLPEVYDGMDAADLISAIDNAAMASVYDAMSAEKEAL